LTDRERFPLSSAGDEAEALRFDGDARPLDVLPHVPAVDVMVTIFCDFRQFSAKFAFFSKTNVIINFLNNLALF
jgi:hypothetical protein